MRRLWRSQPGGSGGELHLNDGLGIGNGEELGVDGSWEQTGVGTSQLMKNLASTHIATQNKSDLINMKMAHLLLLLLVASITASCTTWGYKMPMGKTYPKTDYRLVRVLFAPPEDKYEEIGLCSVLGGAAFITSDVDMFQKLRKAAADMGADAVIVIREQSTRMSSMGGGGSAGAAWNPYGGSYGSSWGFGGSSIEYPRNAGMAIKYVDPARQLPPKQ